MIFSLHATDESDSDCERILKIDQYLAKLQCPGFFDSRVHTYARTV